MAPLIEFWTMLFLFGGYCSLLMGGRSVLPKTGGEKTRSLSVINI